MFWILVGAGFLIFFYTLYSKKSSTEEGIFQPNEGERGDTFEGWFITDADNPKPVEAHLLIKYKDRAGQITKRDIWVKEFDDSDNTQGLIMATCMLRNAVRTFRFDRIIECCDVETGEVISNVKAYLSEKYKASPNYSLSQFFEGNVDPIECLVYIAKSDGRFMANERKEIINYCRRYLSDTRIDDSMIEKVLKDTRTLSINSYRLVVGRLVHLPLEMRENLLETAEKILNTQAKVHPSEQEAFEYLKKRLNT